MPIAPTGQATIKDMFATVKAQNRAAFLPYFPIGYPNYEDSLAAIAAMSEIGADGFEIGVPFSDPLADGPTIQAATQVALENGITVKSCLQSVSDLRQRGVYQPMLLMSYLNPLLAYGVDDFVGDARSAGANGFIVPDLPPEEAAIFAEICQREEMALVFFLAPTSNSERIKLVAENTTGFIYVVSVTGITGARKELPDDLMEFIERVRQQTDKPLVLGFGISTPQHAALMNDLVDGFIVGSALVKAAKEGLNPLRTLTRSLRQALD